MENFTNETNRSAIFGGEYDKGGGIDEEVETGGHYYSECMTLESVESLGQFVRCFRYFVSKSLLVSGLVLSFAVATVILNIAVILFIHRLKSHKTVFDRIFIGHCVVDALVGLLVIPNYCVYIVFGYWPLGKLLCHFYVSLDYTICHVGILHMVYVAYARLRSLQAPKKYHNEWIISHAEITMFVLWIISSVLWLPAVNLIIHLSFKNRECYFTYHPIYIIIQDSIAYLLPLFIILGITGYILHSLHLRNKRRKRLKRRKHLRLPKLIAQEKKRAVLTTKGAQNTVMLKIAAENLSASDVSEFNSDALGTVVMIAAQTTTLTINDETTITKLRPITSFDDVKLDAGSSPRSPLKQKIRPELTKQPSNANSCYESSFTGLHSLEEDSSSMTDGQVVGNGAIGKLQSLARRLKRVNCSFKLNAYAKLYLIITTFCVLWLPFCILWPINAVCETCISSFVYQLSYWMGYGQSLINPILLLILNPNYNKLKADT